MTDPFGTAGLRERVLAAWAASPARFREDANAEEDHALGGYRDRVIVELAQNAADAAIRGGVPGRLLLTLSPGLLTAANTGAPLDAAGVEALSTLRASAKTGDTEVTGRFGVGFAAVVAVSDEPSIASATGGVSWSAARTRAEVAPLLPEELERRGGQVPVLRLPYPAEVGEIPDGYPTVVRLPLRDAETEKLVRHLLDQVGPALMLGLPSLETVIVRIVEETPDASTFPDNLPGTFPDNLPDRSKPAGKIVGVDQGPTGRRSLPDNLHDRVLTAVWDSDGVTIDGVRWRTAEAHGRLGPELLADRPVEERARPVWQLRWAIPVDGLPADVPAVLHAPTVSDEPIGLPALLIGSFPLAPDRRHIAPGPLADHLIERAAECYADLLRTLPVTPSLLDLVPGPMAKGEVDAAIRRGVLSRLPETSLLPTAAGDDRIRGRDAIVVDGSAALIEVLADVLPGLLPSGWPVRHPALAALGVRRMSLADVVDALAALDREPGWWRLLYAALDNGVDRDPLAALPVPLADGRTVRGVRGLLVATDGIDPALLEPLSLRFVHPDAVHPLLYRLGAADAGPRAVLTDQATRAAVAASFDEDDPEPIAEAVLSLVAKAGLLPGELPWLAELALPGDDGEIYPAGELLLPGAPLADVMADDAPFGTADAELVRRWGDETLGVVGALWSFAVVRADDVTDPDLRLDGEEEWAAELADRFDLPPTVLELVAVRDLEFVEHWPEALRLLAEPSLRAAIVEPAHVLAADGRRIAVPSYTAWWLRRHPVLDGARPRELRVPGTDPLLEGVYDEAPADLDPGLVRALGIRTSLDELLAETDGVAELLDRLADPDRTVTRQRLRLLWTALAERDLADESAPDRVRALVNGVPEVVPAGDAIVVDRPNLLPLLAGQPLIVVPEDRAVPLADALELALGSEEVPGIVESTGTELPVPEVVGRILPVAPETYRSHDPLVVDGRPVPWWIRDDVVHADGLAGLARGVTWAVGRWSDRLLVEAALRDPDALATLLAESELD